MKNLCLLDYAGNVRPGRSTIEAIDRVLEGHDNDRLATIRIDDGEIVATPLSDSERDALRGQMAKRRTDALIAALDSVLAMHRTVDGIPGVSAYGASISVDFGDAPWAEQPVLDWAHERALHVVNASPPTTPGKWTRRVEVNLRAESWSPSIVTIRYPAVDWNEIESVARDADSEGRIADASSIRDAAQEVQF